jgi:hypothetical protein
MKRWIVFALLLLTASSAWSITAEEAAQRVISDVCMNNLENTRLTIYDGIQSAGTVLQSFSEKATVPFDAYFFMVDNLPAANWAHPCQWVFVNAETGELSVVDMMSPPRDLKPTVLHEPLTLGSYSYEEIMQRIKKEQTKIFGKEKYESTGGKGKGICYALLIDGGWDQYNNHIRYWDDIAFIYRALINYYQYDKENIIVCMSDGDNPAVDRDDGVSSPLDLDDDGANDYHLDATRTTILAQLQWLVDNTTSNDQVFIFTTDHGDSGTAPDYDCPLCLWNHGYLYPSEFKPYIQNMPAQTKICTFEQCFSGAFPNYLADVPGCISSSAVDHLNYSYAMAPDYMFDTYVYNWTSAVYWQGPGFAGHPDDPVDADSDDSGEVEIDEAHQYAVEHHDPNDINPQYQDPSSIGGVTTLWGNPTGVDIAITQWDLQETSGDGDGICEPGETFSLTPYLQNNGTVTATGVQLTLSTASPIIIIDQATTTCPDIPPGDTQHPSTPLSFTIDDNVDHNQWAELTLHVATNEGYGKNFHHDVGVVNDYGFRDFVEDGQGWWEHQGSLDRWHISTTDSHSPSHCWRCGQTDGSGYYNNMNEHLYSPLILVSDQTKETPYFSFWNNRGLTDTNDVCHILIDDGSGYAELGSYNTSTSGWEQASYDVTSYVNKIVQFDFNMVTNGSGSDALGWNVDDIMVTPNLYTGLSVYNFFTMCEDGKVIVGWQTTDDSDIIGFNLYRRELTVQQKQISSPFDLTSIIGNEPKLKAANSDWEKLNQSLILGASPYHFTDSKVKLDNTYEYRLEAVYDTYRQSEASSTITVQGQTSPFSYHLAQSYPNPSSGQLTIEYALPQTSPVSLKVYNLSGQLVADLLESEQMPGIYSVKWDASNLASGVYIYTLIAGDFHCSKHMVLVK